MEEPPRGGELAVLQAVEICPVTMASKESPLSARENRQALGGPWGDPWLVLGHSHPLAPRTDLPGSSSWSSSPADLHLEPRGHLHPSALTASPDGPLTLKPIRRFVPRSWKKFFRRWRRGPRAEPPPWTSSPDVQCSPPAALLVEPPQRSSLDGEGGSDDREEEEDCKKPPSDATSPSKPGKTPTATSQGGASTALPCYQEQQEAYEQKYAHLRSWPGLLRLLGALELILGGMVFACTAAYIQKDYQWSQLYGKGFLPFSSLSGGGGYSYYGPMTPFVLVVASLVWLVTVILLGLGVTRYYQTILLQSHWWPLTEFALNLLMFLLYMAAAIAYVNDVNRGGLCYSALAYNPLVTALCQVDGGQLAALAFLFLTPLLYLAGFLVCLKMWRHQAAQRMLALPRPVLSRGALAHRVPGAQARPAERAPPRHVGFSEKEGEEVPSHAVPVGHNPRAHVVPDYVLKYPAIASQVEREKYKAVFYDQYSEYRNLRHEIQATLERFKELEALMLKLPSHSQNKKEQSRVSAVWRDYKRKREDPAFQEKQERHRYLRRKLSHLKAQIQAFDSDPREPAMLL